MSYQMTFYCLLFSFRKLETDMLVVTEKKRKLCMVYNVGS